MIMVQLKGGLGNQMFQYAAGRSLSLDQQTDLKLDAYWFAKIRRAGRAGRGVPREYELDLFTLNASIATAVEVRRFAYHSSIRWLDAVLTRLSRAKRTYCSEPHFHFYPGLASRGKEVYLDGYWQSEKYFKNHEEAIRRDFTFRKKPKGMGQALSEQILGCESVCVNVRRGDFVTEPGRGTMGPGYYAAAEAILASKLSRPRYFVFSDDLEWCRQSLKFSSATVFVGHEYAGERFGEYLQLMSRCKHFIIPNSTFAWWAAWLNEDTTKIIVAPKRWFEDGRGDTRDLMPEAWLTL